MTKKEFRKTKEWIEFSKRLREKHNYRCELCGSKIGVGVHHIREENYEDLSDENNFVVCCFVDHKRIHNLASSKTINLDDYLDKIKQIVLRMKDKQYE